MPSYRIVKTNRPVGVNLYAIKPEYTGEWIRQRFIDDYDTIFESCGAIIDQSKPNDFLILFKVDRDVARAHGFNYFGIYLKFLERVES